MREEAVIEEKKKKYSTPLNKNPKDRHHDNYQDCSQLLQTQAASRRSQGCDNQSSACPSRTVGEIYII